VVVTEEERVKAPSNDAKMEIERDSDKSKTSKPSKLAKPVKLEIVKPSEKVEKTQQKP